MTVLLKLILRRRQTKEDSWQKITVENTKITRLSTKTSRKTFVGTLKPYQKVDSYYLRAKSTCQYTDRGKSVADLHRDHVKDCKNPADGHVHPYGNYIIYYRCELCQAFEVVGGPENKKYENNMICIFLKKIHTMLRKLSITRCRVTFLLLHDMTYRQYCHT
ncbi:hypothetical protein PR048_011467 [Dryococelus australis]|uniref:Uncharacterized protein n=1 Tax=Dryococelus australis TaxID=614101 RepID=A0ABQ9HLM4_9NEOP|nr:hypothetical protein PR048_011467 [Dryococelus australis]